MKTIIPLLVIPFTVVFPAQAEMITVNVNRVCAAIVNIPYASDNFTDEEWEQFKSCRAYLRQFNGVE
jgi:hypothetical protein